tara:strand:- start:276 stop:443 length:168 start_codon:yes stop_codon:yes gene_type:complete
MMNIKDKAQLNSFISDLKISLKLARDLKLNPDQVDGLNLEELITIVTEKILTYSK